MLWSVPEFLHLESENEANEEVEGKDQGLKIKIEEILNPHERDE